MTMRITTTVWNWKNWEWCSRVTTGRHSSVFCVCYWCRVVDLDSIVLLSNNSLIVLSYNKLWHFALAVENTVPCKWFKVWMAPCMVTLVIVILGHGPTTSTANTCTRLFLFMYNIDAMWELLLVFPISCSNISLLRHEGIEIHMV